MRENEIKTSFGDEALLAKRGVKKILKCVDPSGIPLEFYHTPNLSEKNYAGPIKNGFVADDQGFGHVVVSCHDQDANSRFYLDILGFKLSDTIKLDFGRMKFNIIFTHINSRHHSLAFSSPMPKRIHHFMLQTRDIDEVGKAFDRARRHKIEISQELGRHSNDKMFSFYAKTPSGFEFEFGADAIEIDDSVWKPQVYTRGSDWGHHRPKTFS